MTTEEKILKIESDLEKGYTELTAEDLMLSGDRVLVRVPKSQEIRKGNLILPPDSAASLDLPRVGRIANVHLDTKEFPVHSALKIGNFILFGKYAGTEIKLSDGDSSADYLIMRESDIISFINKQL